MDCGNEEFTTAKGFILLAIMLGPLFVAGLLGGAVELLKPNKAVLSIIAVCYFLLCVALPIYSLMELVNVPIHNTYCLIFAVILGLVFRIPDVLFGIYREFFDRWHGAGE